ncbi:MAG TPA: 5'/3'-nucleotidase SurE [Sphingobium sp.]
MRILLSNDDGYHAPGLKVLEAIARTLSDDIWIVAPGEEQSGASHSLTLSHPLRIRQHGEKRYSVSGTPTDAVALAIGHIMKDARPDLVLSGVNRGANLAEDVTYSGTVAAAMEGAIYGVRSIALSQVYSRENAGDSVPFDAASAWGERVVRQLLTLPAQPNMLLNVNFPPIAADAVKGVRVVRQGFHAVDRTKIVECTDPRGYPYYWLGLGLTGRVPEGTDLEAIAHGYVTVTPLHYDLTHDASLAALAEAFGD